MSGEMKNTDIEFQDIDWNAVLGIPLYDEGSCKGTYKCVQDGSTCKSGLETLIRFLGMASCPDTTDLGDGSSCGERCQRKSPCYE